MTNVYILLSTINPITEAYKRNMSSAMGICHLEIKTKALPNMTHFLDLQESSLDL
jgi:hypothetical protein